ALRFDFTPARRTLSQWPFPETSFRRSDGGSFMFITRTSTSPPLSKSPKAPPAAGVGPRPSRTRFVDQLLEAPVAEVAKDEPGRAVGIGGKRLLDLGVDAARHHEEVGEAVVVEVHHPRAP